MTNLDEEPSAQVKVIWLITTSFGRNADSHTIRLDNLLYHLPRNRYKLILLTPNSNEANNSGIARVDSVISTSAPPFRKLIEHVENYPKFGERMGWVLKNLFYRTLVPDSFLGWRRQIIAHYVKTSEKPDIIISASGSPESHVAAYKLKQISGCAWIADLGDPWHKIDQMQRPLLAGIVKRLERKVFTKVDSMIFTTQSTKRDYDIWLAKFNPIKTDVIPYGYNDIRTPHINKTDSSKIRFAHVGTAHRTDRNLIPLIRAIKKSQLITPDRYAFTIAGRRSPIFDQVIDELSVSDLERHQTVSYERSLELQAACDVIVIVGNLNGHQVPGKIYVALGLYKPILYISQCDEKDDEALRTLRTCVNPVVASNNEDSILNAIHTIDSSLVQLVCQSTNELAKSKIRAFDSLNLSNSLTRIIAGAMQE